MKWITWAMVLALCSLQYQIWIPQGGGLRLQYAKMQAQADAIKQQNETLRLQNAVLRAEVNDLQNGFEALSEIARTEMHYIEEGETFYTLRPQ
ncbi:septum formation initiator family protein [Wielerella bovis]|uniref:FtsB family cell division protein n=1 Tax=Wielerella bovis TaxID=2917790 RepID=UPI002019DD06|nr:septum formation initiator family protein [Wielerella bovis]ULJ60830.1 septum formation initiator family protein [Wielerella bovis]ULJ62962.1 septum formation initiator family protein [Wielerella bovis]